MLLDEDVVPRGVVGDPVEDHLEPEVVRGLDEVSEILDGAELGARPSSSPCTAYGLPSLPLRLTSPIAWTGMSQTIVDAEGLQAGQVPPPAARKRSFGRICRWLIW